MQYSFNTFILNNQTLYILLLDDKNEVLPHLL